MKKLFVIIITVIVLVTIIKCNSEESNSNWSSRAKLPVIVSEKIKPEIKDSRIHYDYGSISFQDSTIKSKKGEQLPDSATAEKISMNFIKTIYPSYSDSLVLTEIEYNFVGSGRHTKADSDTVMILSFSLVWNGIKVFCSGFTTYIIGNKVESAVLHLSKITSIVSNSERKIISKSKAIEIWNNYLNQKEEPKFAELQYNFFPDDNPSFDANKLKLRPHWIFNNSDPMVDAFDGGIWRND